MEAIGALRFRGEWRRYQQLALDAFEADRTAGHASTHLVAPPGSGKTLLGFEIVRRLGVPALVLAPNAAIQAQWLRTGAAFAAPPGLVAADALAPVACLTYQALARLEDPGAALRGAAETRWAAERAAATGQAPDLVAAEAAAWTGAAAQRRTRELARITASLKRAIARREAIGDDADGGAPDRGGAASRADGVAPDRGGAGDHADARLRLADLLAPGARERVAALRSRGVRTVVLDECHHLASLWGYVVRALLEELGEGVHVVGLTATPPDELTTEEADLYAALLGPVDFQVPTPAVVRDGHLAPYQELAWLTEPLTGEQRWLAEHETRFRELVTGLLDVDEQGPLDLGQWVITRLRHRTREGGEAEVPWSDFQRRHPALAAAGVRFLGSAGLPLPPGAPRGEAHRRPPDLADWVVLLEDWVLRCLDVQSAPAAAARRAAVAAALRDLGYNLTRTGIRRAASDVDRLLTGSAAKPLALVEVLGAEADARGTGLRALVLCDAELAGARPDGELRDVLDPDAGTARAGVRALAGDLRTAVLRPLLVSGRGLRCAVDDADALLAALAAVDDAAAVGGAAATPVRGDGTNGALRESTGEGWRAEASGDGLAELRGPGAWTSRRWVGLATAIFEQGVTRTLVGTRAFLGEGWNAPCVNCLVDLTSAATGVSVRQMRGRSLRLDPADPEKVASNWDVVCVAPGHAQGAADYARFVRKHRHLHAPADDGTLEAGVGHVHPDLSPFAPPPADHFPAIARAMAARAADRDAARARWNLGAPYEGHEVDTLVLHPRGPRTTPVPPAPADEPPALALGQRGLLAAGLAGGVTSAAGAIAAGPLALAVLPVAAALGVAALVRTRRVVSAYPAVAPLDRIARAVCDAYVALGELRRTAAASLVFEPRASGYLRCRLAEATPAEAARVTAALDALLGPVERPRYLLSRLVAPPDPAPPALVRMAAGDRDGLVVAWHAVPDDLGRHRERAGALAAAWERWFGPCELQFTQRDRDGRDALAAAAAQEWSFDTQRRAVWQ